MSAYSAGSQDCERTALLGSNGAESTQGSDQSIVESTQKLPGLPKETHYRDIDGRSFWFLFGGILFGCLIGFFQSTLMSSSHPVITSYFHASNAASWLSTVYFLSSTVFQPIFGRISDTIGRKPVYLFSIVAFLLTTIWCALAQSIGSFIAARLFSGVGGGGLMAISFILIGDVVKLEYRGVYQSYVNIVYGLGSSMGAAFGGILCDTVGWRAAFGLQVPFLLVYLILAYLTTPTNLGPNLAKSEGKTVFEAMKTFDATGSAVLTILVSCLILGINLGGSILSWTHPFVISSLILFAILIPFMVFVEHRAIRPILPLPLLSTVPMANVMWANVLSNISVQTVLFNVPLFFQAVCLTSPTTAGLYLISPLVCLTISSVLAGFFITWTRRMKPTMMAGVLCGLGGAVTTTCLSPEQPPWAMLMLIPWASLGQGFFAPSTTIAVLSLSSQEDQAVVVTTLGLLRNLGSVLGVAVSSWVLQNALLISLDRNVQGKDEIKRQVILQVRKSINAIATLDPYHRRQVVEAYSQALRATFLSGIIFALAVVVLILPIRLPRLPNKS